MIKLFNSRKILTAVLFILWLNYFISPAGSQNNSVKSAHTFVEMIPQFETLKVGQTFSVGLNFVTDKDWHIYWQNPGDSGLAPKIEWNLPNNFQVGEIIWPAPERIKAEPLTSFGYHHGAFLLTEIQSPSDFENQKELMLSAKVSWLECKEECLPGAGEFHINIPLTQADATVNPKYLKHYDKYKSQYPIDDISAHTSMIQTPTDFIIKYTPSTFDEGLIFTDFFPYDSNLIDYNVLPEFKTVSRMIEITLRKALSYQEGKNERLRGVLVGHMEGSDEIRAFEVDVSMPSNILQTEVAENSQENKLNIFLAIIFAFWGGMVLNLMPCVLPVLTIKVLGLVEKSKNEKSKFINNGLQFTLGILVSFWVLSIIMLLLRFVGKQVGWGYQFQSPYFVVAMTILFFVLALNLFGLFEIGTTFTRLKSTEFAFLNGVLATLVATPCTAPFMGSAIGFALAKPPIYTFIIFTSIGIGMA
ncbi:MAG: hypothetical protein KBD53_09145, partial [Candidatus Omnitrophica bacterium]|nr:hypothetical protein [Candidatus Omnitrophota bacterium]